MFQKNSGSEKAYGKKGGVSRVPVEKFLSHRAEKFLGEPFCAVFQKTSGSEIFMDKRGVCQYFPSKNFCLRVPKKFRGEPFCAVFQKTSGSENFMDKRGGGCVRISRRKFFVSGCRKNS